MLILAVGGPFVFARCRLVGGRSELRGILGWVVAKQDELQLVLRVPMFHILSAFQIGRICFRSRQTDEKQTVGRSVIPLSDSSVVSHVLASSLVGATVNVCRALYCFNSVLLQYLFRCCAS